MAYPTYRQDFEGGTTLGTACPEVVDFSSAYSIDSSGANAFTGTHSLKLVSGDARAYTNTNDTLSGNVTLTVYAFVTQANGFCQIVARVRTAGVLAANNWIRLLFNTSGITIGQDDAGSQSTINTPISGSVLPTNLWFCLELRCNGTTVSARVVRQDTGQFFVNTGSGSWSSTPQVQTATTTVTGAGGIGYRGGDTTYQFVDDWIIEPAVPSIDNPTFSLSGIGTTQQLTAGGFTDPLYGVTWSSSNTGVATVTSGGLVTAVANGTATITATGKRDTGQTATATATIAQVYVQAGAVGVRSGVAGGSSGVGRPAAAAGLKAGTAATRASIARPTVGAGLRGGAAASYVTMARPAAAVGVRSGVAASYVTMARPAAAVGASSSVAAYLAAAAYTGPMPDPNFGKAQRLGPDPNFGKAQRLGQPR